MIDIRDIGRSATALVLGAGAAATTDWKLVAATAAGSFAAFLMHRTLSSRDLKRVAAAAAAVEARRIVDEEQNIRIRILSRVVDEGLERHEKHCAARREP